MHRPGRSRVDTARVARAVTVLLSQAMQLRRSPAAEERSSSRRTRRLAAGTAQGAAGSQPRSLSKAATRSSVGAVRPAAGIGQSRQRRTPAHHGPSGLKAVVKAASATSAAASCRPRKRAPGRRRGRPWPGRGMSPTEQSHLRWRGHRGVVLRRLRQLMHGYAEEDCTLSVPEAGRTRCGPGLRACRSCRPRDSPRRLRTWLRLTSVVPPRSSRQCPTEDGRRTGTSRKREAFPPRTVARRRRMASPRGAHGAQRLSRAHGPRLRG